jgi:phosphoserine aminotransferase
LAVIERRNREKASLLYDAIDRHPDLYRGHAHLDSRSAMTVTFRLRREELEASFLAQAEAAGLIGLKGHRLVGGFRASLYNAMSLDGVQALVEHMDRFAEQHG